MTSGVYRRRQDSNVGKKPMFNETQCQWIRDTRSAGMSVKLLSSKLLCSEKTIREVLRCTGAYKGTK